MKLKYGRSISAKLNLWYTLLMFVLCVGLILSLVTTAKTTQNSQVQQNLVRSVERNIDEIEVENGFLDVMMPKKDGFTVLTEMRQQHINTPVIFLTAKTEISDRVHGLDLGANDYLIKPFSFEELAARVRMITRDSKGNSTNIFSVGDLTVDIKSREVKRGNDRIDLSAREYSILEVLIRNAGTVMSREKIESGVWNYDYEGGTNVIDVYIRYLRKKIDDDYDVKLIHTVRGVGYVLREDVSS